MPVQVLFFAALAVASIPVMIWAMRGVNVDIPNRRRKLVRANLGPSAAPDMRDVVLEQSAWDRLVRPAAGHLAGFARHLTPSGLLESLEQQRDLAGIDARWSIERILAIKVVLGIVGLLVGLLLFVPDPTAMMFIIAAVFTVGGFYGPDMVLGARARERQGEIERAFPNTLDQITICVEAGLGLDAAIAHAARTGTGPLADELNRTLQDIQLGLGRQPALEGLVERTDVGDIRSFVVAIGQANRYGVPVAQALRVQATEGRERRSNRAQERAQKMSVKLLFPLVFCILPALFVVLLGPAAIRIANMGLGGN